MTPSLLETLFRSVGQTVIEHAGELTALDQAIGDGDHGINMKRGFDAVLAELDTLKEKPLGEALKTGGMKLVMSVGGASGPLYGTLFMTLGKGLGDGLDREAVGTALSAAIDAVKARGKSDVGHKTMLDVRAPACAALQDGGSLSDIRTAADAAAEATIPMQAQRGRASFLGERSIGHMDPGARSSALIISAVCNVLEEQSDG